MKHVVNCTLLKPADAALKRREDQYIWHAGGNDLYNLEGVQMRVGLQVSSCYF